MMQEVLRHDAGRVAVREAQKTVEVRASAQALDQLGNGPGYESTFREHRDLLERIASKKWDEGESQVIITTQDLRIR
jgi:hypothetical protein